MMVAKNINAQTCKSVINWCSDLEVALMGAWKKKSLATPTINIVAELYSYHPKQK